MPTQTNKLVLWSGWVAGVQFTPYKERAVTCESITELVPEPDNRFDKNAIRIDLDKQKLGYVPKTDTGLIHAYLDKKQIVLARLIEFRPQDKTHLMFKVEAYVWEEV